MAEGAFDRDDYASTKLRWSFFRTDHPNGTVKHELRPGGSLGIPSAFGGGLDYIVAYLFDRDFDVQGDETILEAATRAGAQLLAQDQKEIPEQEERWSGPKGQRVKSMVPFARTPDSWRTICGKATGRALVKCGYPDSQRALRPALLWRERVLQLRMMAAGGQPIAELTVSTEIDEALANAGTPIHPDNEPDVEPDDDEQPAADDEPVDAEVLPDDIDTMGRPALVKALGDLQLATNGDVPTLRDRLREATKPFELQSQQAS